LHFLAGLGSDQAVDLMAALLWVGLERALLHLTTQTFLNSLHEATLSLSLLLNNDGSGAVDLGPLLAVALLARSLGLLDIVGALKTADQGCMGLLALLLTQTWALSALHLSLSVASGTLLQSSQSHLDSNWRDDGVLVITFLFGLLVQLGSQSAVGLFQMLQELEVGLALLLASLSLVQAVLATALPLLVLVVSVVFLILILVLILIIVLALAIPASALLLVFVVVHVTVIPVCAIVVFIVLLAIETILLAVETLLVLPAAADQLVEAPFVVQGASRRSKTQKSNQNDETHFGQ